MIRALADRTTSVASTLTSASYPQALAPGLASWAGCHPGAQAGIVSVTTLPAPEHSSSAAKAARTAKRGHLMRGAPTLTGDQSASLEASLRSTALLLLLLAGVSAPRVVFAQAPQHAMPPALRCPGDKVVWVNTRSGIYHFQGERYFGSTKEGKFLCEHDADKATGPCTTASDPTAQCRASPGSRSVR